MRKICIFTGTRPEYGLLRWVMQGIQDAPSLLQFTLDGNAFPYYEFIP